VSPKRKPGKWPIGVNPKARRGGGNSSPKKVQKSPKKSKKSKPVYEIRGII
jgi:hypothetical protein